MVQVEQIGPGQATGNQHAPLRTSGLVTSKLGDYCLLREIGQGACNLQAGAAMACNNLAWRYVMGSEREGDLKKALPLAQMAVKLDPKESLNTLGVVYYRLGHYGQAMEALQRSLQLTREESAAFGCFSSPYVTPGKAPPTRQMSIMPRPCIGSSKTKARCNPAGPIT
jgi:tetratricopeptide (TPR) repeat protein